VPLASRLSSTIHLHWRSHSIHALSLGIRVSSLGPTRPFDLFLGVAHGLSGRRSSLRVEARVRKALVEAIDQLHEACICMRDMGRAKSGCQRGTQSSFELAILHQVRNHQAMRSRNLDKSIYEILLPGELTCLEVKFRSSHDYRFAASSHPCQSMHSRAIRSANSCDTYSVPIHV
jgi:hypothetical protein